ncbi:MAG: hypothetical protein RR472_05735, partial [Anaerovoracaceae bacterium]
MMDMTFSFTPKDIGLFLIFVGLIVLIVYLVILTKALIESVQRTNRILEDAEKITAVAQKR